MCKYRLQTLHVHEYHFLSNTAQLSLPPGLLAVQISQQLSKPTFMLACAEWFYNVIYSMHVLGNMVKHSRLEERVTCHGEPRINCMFGQH